MSTAAKRVEERDLRAVLEQTEPLWSEVRGERIFLTGATGFFGAWLLETFSYINRELDLHAEAVALSRRPEIFRARMPHLFVDGAITLHAGDVRDFAAPEGKFRYVVHAATEASAKQAAEAPAEMLTTILDGTRRTLDVAVAAGAQRVLLTSSGAVYGRQPSEVVQLPETYAGAPDCTQVASIYGEGKRASELLCALYAKQYGIECAIARCWAFCGPHLALDIHFAIGNFIRDVMAGGPIRIGGDGTPTRSYLYAGDLATWLWTMLFRAPSLTAYNVGSEHSVSIRELAEAVRDALDPSVAIEIAKEAVPGAPVARYVPSVAKAAEELGLRETVNLRNTILRTAAWYGWTEVRTQEGDRRRR